MSTITRFKENYITILGISLALFYLHVSTEGQLQVLKHTITEQSNVIKNTIDQNAIKTVFQYENLLGKIHDLNEKYRNITIHITQRQQLEANMLERLTKLEQDSYWHQTRLTEISKNQQRPQKTKNTKTP